uniref:Corticotropin-releasing factor domain-containing protein n=1 Tax=Strigops habroptila TaxID=2489341 RepID=A0A672V0I1_STRHB
MGLWSRPPRLGRAGPAPPLPRPSAPSPRGPAAPVPPSCSPCPAVLALAAAAGHPTPRHRPGAPPAPPELPVLYNHRPRRRLISRGTDRTPPAAYRQGRGTAHRPWRARRDEPPLSIDLTFHLLRHLLLLARAQSQRAQADSNRLILDAVGR